MLGVFTRYLLQSFQYLLHFTGEETEVQSFYITLPDHRGSSHRTATQKQVWKAIRAVFFSGMLYCPKHHFRASLCLISFIDSGHATIIWGLDVLFCEAFPDTLLRTRAPPALNTHRPECGPLWTPSWLVVHILVSSAGFEFLLSMVSSPWRVLIPKYSYF